MGLWLDRWTIVEHVQCDEVICRLCRIVFARMRCDFRFLWYDYRKMPTSYGKHTLTSSWPQVSTVGNKVVQD
jgi:hypothetical protein